jgi:hypothetical protein
MRILHVNKFLYRRGGAEGYMLDGGRLYAAGDFHSIGGRAQRFLAALDTGGGNDAGWHPQATCPGLGLTVAAGSAYMVCGGASASGAWLWMGGDFTKVAGISQPHVARFGPAGATTATQIGFANPTLDGPAQRFREALLSFTR